ncbi:MAG: hypothetical protein WCW02_04405 [Candidatus Buchananbacteria bacterium]
MSKSIGVIGGGMVGGAIKGYFPQALIYDKFLPQDELERVLVCDYIFIAVPTPFTDKFDLSIMDEAFGYLTGLKDKIVIIKSTVLPGTTDDYQVKYPNLKILFNPEFLTEVTALDDFKEPDRQIVGFTDKSQAVAAEVLQLLPKAPYQKIMPAKSAEMIKYMFNTFYATKVVFANQVYDLCQKIEVDYEQVKEAFLTEKKNLFNHFNIWHKDYRGYGGKCLPKDLNALVELADKNKVDLKLLKTVREINNQLEQKK